MLCPQSVFMCFVRILEQTAIISLHIKRLVSITERVFTAPYGPNHNIQFRSRRGTRQKVMDRLDKERLCALYCSPNFIREFESRRMRRAGHVAVEGYTGFCWGDLTERDHLEDLGVDGEHTIKVGLQEVGWRGVDWIELAQDRHRWRTLVNAAMNFRVPLNAGKFLASWEPVSFSGRTLPHRVS